MDRERRLRHDRPGIRAPLTVERERSPAEMCDTELVRWMQRAAGNRAVTSAMRRPDVRQPGAGAGSGAAGTATSGGPVVQRWWAGTRQLSGLGWLGNPWDLGGNPADLGIYHKHIFLEDGQSPSDIGHMGPQGLGQDTEHSESEYTVTVRGEDDETMRSAIDAHSPAPAYSLFSTNCQRWVRNVISTYHRMGGTSQET